MIRGNRRDALDKHALGFRRSTVVRQEGGSCTHVGSM